ncbi:MAG: DUF378 domain-containing protein [Clostridia bacterium]|nr:DUF378 domain-containing protein [Clostridia bacterium]
MKVINAIVLTLVIIGGINWGLIGLFNYNLVEALFGSATWFTRLVYILVGVSGLWAIAFYSRSKNRS